MPIAVGLKLIKVLRRYQNIMGEEGQLLHICPMEYLSLTMGNFNNPTNNLYFNPSVNLEETELESTKSKSIYL